MMDAKQLEELKKKIDAAKNKKARAEGSLDNIKAQLKKEFEVNTLKEAQAQLDELNKDIEKDELRFKELTEELNEITDWDAL